MLSIAYFMGIKIVRIWQKKQDYLILVTALLFFALPTPWLSSGLQFLFVIIFDKTLSGKFLLLLIAWSIPTLTTSWVYITSSLYKNKSWSQWAGLLVPGIPGLLFIIWVYFLGSWEIKEIPNAIQVNFVYVGLPNYIIYYFGILGILFVFPSYAYISIKSDNNLVKAKTGFIALSSLLYAIAGVWDGAVTFQNITVVIILRVILTISLIFLYLGYNTPERIKQKFQ